MKKFLRLQLAMLLALSIAFTACDDEDPAPTAPDISGSWALTDAALLAPATITVKNAGGPGVDLTFEEGDNITALVGAALAANACDEAASYASFLLDLGTVADGSKIYLNCVAESNRPEAGTYTLRDPDGDGVFNELGLNVQLPGVAIPINLTMSDAVITSAQISGSIAGYPMKKDAALPLDDPSGNLQTITSSIQFTKAP